ncbi:hypothetical protein [Haloechinothrix salitolerans]|uniref:Uncharacterized protein n=1 Tax=Haloechinothrix salitolerans TaxID=926830 RepID=A0ABW2C247_9PSEU
MESRDVTVTFSVALTNRAHYQGSEAWNAVAHAMQEELADFAYRDARTGFAFESESVNTRVKPKSTEFGEYGPHDYGDIR